MERKTINFYWFTQQQLTEMRNLFTSHPEMQNTEYSNRCLKVLMLSKAPAIVSATLEREPDSIKYQDGEQEVSNEMYQQICKLLHVDFLTRWMLNENSIGVMLNLVSKNGIVVVREKN